MTETSPSSSRRWLAKIARPQTPPPWSVMDVFFTFVALAVSILLIGPTIAGMVFTFNPTPTLLLTSWLIGLALTLLFLGISRQRQAAALRLGAKDSQWPLPYALLVGVGAGLTINVLVGLVGGFHPMPTLNGVGHAGAGEWILAGVFVAVVQPLSESLVFQGVALPRLRASLGPWPGFLAATLIYCVYFVAIYSATIGSKEFIWYGIGAPVLISLVLNGVRVYTESTRAVIFAQVGMGLTFLLAAITLVG